jgi:SulP family sulfate permease
MVAAMLGQSLINVSNGARARLSELLQPLLYAFVMFGAGLIEILPMAALYWTDDYGCHWNFQMG